MNARTGFALCCLLATAAVPGSAQIAKTFIRKPVVARPLISRAVSQCIHPTGQFEIWGKYFGASQGTRVVRINGVALPTVLAWENGHVRCAHAYGFPGGETVHVDIFDTAGNERISNVFDTFVPICIYALSPEGPLRPKMQVTLGVEPGVGAAAYGRKVMIGGMEAPAKWMIRKIVFVVPLLAPGSYLLRLEKDGKTISTEVAVTVQN